MLLISSIYLHQIIFFCLCGLPYSTGGTSRATAQSPGWKTCASSGYVPDEQVSRGDPAEAANFGGRHPVAGIPVACTPCVEAGGAGIRCAHPARGAYVV